MDLRNEHLLLRRLEEYRMNYGEKLLSLNGYYDLFAHKMNKVFE